MTRGCSNKLARAIDKAFKAPTWFGRKRELRIDHEEPDPAPRLPFAEGPWLLAFVNVRSEAHAVESLKEEGYPAWYPMETRWVSDGRVRRRKHFPLFPRYIFVGANGFADRQQRPTVSVANCKHVQAVVSDATGWIAVRWATLASWDARQASGEFDASARIDPRTMLPVARYSKGDTIEVTSGPFATFQGEINQVKPDDRVEILLNIFGALQPVELDATEIVKIAYR